MSSQDNEEECAMHAKSDNIEIMINVKTDEVIEETFQSLLSKYQIDLETSIRVSDYILDYVHLLYQKCHKITLKRGGSLYRSS